MPFTEHQDGRLIVQLHRQAAVLLFCAIMTKISEKGRLLDDRLNMFHRIDESRRIGRPMGQQQKEEFTMRKETNAPVQTDNDNATCRVPLSQRHSTFDVAIVAAGFCVCMSGLFTGASLAMGLNLTQAIIASVIGNIILSLYGGAVGMAGAREGVATSMLARHSFGRQGSKIISLVLALSMAGWYSVQVGFFGDTIHAMFPNAGIITEKWAAALWGGILMLLSAYFGYKGLAVLSKIAIPLIAITSIIGIYASVNHAGGWSTLVSMQPAQNIGVGAGIVMVVGSFAGGASAQADITRYAKDAKAAWIGTLIGYMVANLFIIVAGFITNMATGAGDLPAAMLALGLGFPALIVLIGAQWTTNDNNLYTSSLGITNIIHVKKKHVTLTVGIVATLIGAAGLSDHFSSWLNVLGIGLPPMAGIILADYFFVHKMHYDFGTGTKYYAWNLVAFASWIIACLAGYFVTWGVASINSLVVGLVIYVAAMHLFGKKGTGMIGETVEE